MTTKPPDAETKAIAARMRAAGRAAMAKRRPVTDNDTVAAACPSCAAQIDERVRGFRDGYRATAANVASALLESGGEVNQQVRDALEGFRAMKLEVDAMAVAAGLPARGVPSLPWMTKETP